MQEKHFEQGFIAYGFGAIEESIGGVNVPQPGGAEQNHMLPDQSFKQVDPIFRQTQPFADLLRYLLPN
jgi:hypothetical protein